MTIMRDMKNNEAQYRLHITATDDALARRLGWTAVRIEDGDRIVSGVIDADELFNFEEYAGDDDSVVSYEVDMLNPCEEHEDCREHPELGRACTEARSR